MQPTRLAPASFLKHASEVAFSYGFRPLRELERRLGAERRAHSFAVAAGLTTQSALQPQSEPVLVYWAGGNPVSPARAAPTLPMREVGEFGLQIAGVSASVGEVVLLKTVATILNEWGVSVARVRLNALGDRDSKARFEREVGIYLRKHLADLGEECRDTLGKNPMGPYYCTSELCRGVTAAGPRAMSFLSEKSRAHFKEVLEHLEKLSLPYEFDDLLLGDEREPKVVFAFDFGEGDATVLSAAGGRYDDYFRKLAPRRELSGVGASIYFRKKGLGAGHFQLHEPARSPAVYFIQLGVRAKLEGLFVTDALRRARVPVLQSFDSSHLSHQLARARAAGVSHLIIMGEREALDHTVLIRTTEDNSQHTVGVSDLPRYLKALR